MRALEKDRNRRYGTPSDLALDIGRYHGGSNPCWPALRVRCTGCGSSGGVTASVSPHLRRCSTGRSRCVFTGTVVTAQAEAHRRWNGTGPTVEAEIANRTEEFLIGICSRSRRRAESRGNSVTAVELLEQGTVQAIERDLADRPGGAHTPDANRRTGLRVNWAWHPRVEETSDGRMIRGATRQARSDVDRLRRQRRKTNSVTLLSRPRPRLDRGADSRFVQAARDGSAKAAWARSGPPSRRSRCAAGRAEDRSSAAWTPTRSSPASRPSGRPWP